MSNIGTLVATITANTLGLQQGLAKSKSAIKDFERSANQSSKALGGFTKLAALAGGAVGIGAVIRGFTSMATVGMEFEQTMKTVGGVMRATGDEYDMLVAKAREMGATTEWTAKQAGDALQFLGMAGFQASEAAGALPGVLDLATAANVDLGRSADIASNALTAFQLPVNQLTRVNDVFVGTITRSNTNMEQLAEAFKYAAPVAKAYGYEIEELAGLIGKAGDAGIQGSMAGTALTRAFTDAKKIAAEMNMESGDLVDVLTELRKRGYDAEGAMNLFELRAAKVVGVLYDNIEATRDFQKELYNVEGEANRLATTMRDTVQGSFRTLQSTIQETMLAAFEDFGGGLRDAIQWITTWIRENKAAILAFVKLITTMLSAVAGVIAVVTDLIGSFATGAVEAFNNIGESAQRAATDTASAGGKIRKALSIDPSPLQAMVLWLDNLGDAMLGFAKYLLKSLGSLIGNSLAAIGYTIGDVAQTVYWGMRVITSAITGQFDDAKRAWSKFTNEFNDIAKHWSDAFGAYIGTAGAEWDKFQKELDPRSVQERFMMDYAGLKKIEGLPPDLSSMTQEQLVRFVFQADTSVFDEITKKQQEVADAANKNKSELDNFFDALDNMDFSKGVGHFDDLAQSTEAAGDALSDEVELLKEYLSYTDLTATQAAAAWEQYKNLRIQQIQEEAAAMVEAGRDAVIVYQTMQKRLQNIGSELDVRSTTPSVDISRTFDAELGTLEKYLQANKITSEQSAKYWNDYYRLRTDQIRREAQALADMGVNAGIIYQTMSAEVAGLSDEYANLVGATQEAMGEIEATVTESMKWVFEDFFTQELQRAAGIFEGEVRTIGDYWKMFWNDMMVMVARNAADEITAIVKSMAKSIWEQFAEQLPGWLSGGGGGGGGAPAMPTNTFPDVTGMQHGGIVTKPSLIFAAEAGPEAIIPMSKLNDRNTWERMGIGGDTVNNSVTFNVQTDDVRSFKMNATQFMSQASVALSRGRRNL